MFADKEAIPMKKNTYWLAFWIVYTLSFFAKCFYFQFTTELNTIPLFSAENAGMLLSYTGILLLCTGLLLLLTSRRRAAALTVFVTVVSVILLCDTNFYRYYYGFITLESALQLNPGMMTSVRQSIWSLFTVWDVLYLIDLPLLIFLAVRCPKRQTPLKARYQPALAAFLAGVVLLTGLTLHADIGAFTYNDNYTAKKMGVLYSHFANTGRFLETQVFAESQAPEREAVDAFFENRVQPETSYSRGAAQGKNLIVVQMESIQQFVIGARVEGQEITPNLNRFLEESLYFDHIYYQVGDGNTSDAEFLTNTSLYPSRDGSVYTEYAQNTYHSLGTLLKEEGYRAFVFHAFPPDFWNRSGIYPSLGYDRFYSKGDYSMDEFAGWEGDNALSDRSFFRQSLQMLDTGEPFYGFFVTLSSHHPFTWFASQDFAVGDYEGTYLGNYLKAAHYADSCIGDFLEELKQNGLYDESLIVLYGDHSAIPRHHREELLNFTGADDNPAAWRKLQRVPLMMHYPALSEPERVSVTGGQIDILPTVANLMGFDAPYAMGKDLLNCTDGYAVFRNGSLVTEEYLYDGDSKSVFRLDREEEVSRLPYQDEILKRLRELTISDSILKWNYFAD